MEPMLSAISENGIPKGDRWEYEPKWDGFRTRWPAAAAAR